MCVCARGWGGRSRLLMRADPSDKEREREGERKGGEGKVNKLKRSDLN